MLKVSDYNFIWPVEGSDKAVIFNSFTTATIEINRHYLDLLEDGSRIEPDSLDIERKKAALELAKGGFLIEDFVDEMSILRYRNAKGRFNGSNLFLTVIPTFNCSLKCFYCYQDRNIVIDMTSEVQDGIVRHVEKSAKGLKSIGICWFGGEPLLAWNTICSLSERIIKIADENGCKYIASIITNGYLFDDEKIEKLKEMKISTVQITLDGPPAIHSRRKGIPGDPSDNFNKILSTIEKLIQNGLNVSIRVNIDKTNMNSVEELLDILAERKLDEAVIYPGQVTADTKVCRNVEEACLHTEEFAVFETEFYKLLVEKGLKADFSYAYPEAKMNFCCADHVNSFTIGPDGYVYKCWSEIDGKNDMVLDILEREQDEQEKKKMRMRDINWISCSPFEFPECAGCKLLPVCMGGCPHSVKVENNGKPVCMALKNNLEQTVMNHYYCMKIDRLFKS